MGGLGRPPKLTDWQKAVIGRRLAAGESGRQLAKEYKVAEATIRLNFSAHTAAIQNIATRLATAELDMERLPPPARLSTRTFADQLKGMQESYMAGAAKGLRTADKLHTAAEDMVDLLDRDKMGADDLRLVAALVQTANQAATMGTNLLNANKEATKTPELSLAELIGSVPMRGSKKLGIKGGG